MGAPLAPAAPAFWHWSPRFWAGGWVISGVGVGAGGEPEKPLDAQQGSDAEEAELHLNAKILKGVGRKISGMRIVEPGNRAEIKLGERVYRVRLSELA